MDLKGNKKEANYLQGPLFGDVLGVPHGTTSINGVGEPPPPWRAKHFPWVCLQCLFCLMSIKFGDSGITTQSHLRTNSLKGNFPWSGLSWHPLRLPSKATQTCKLRLPSQKKKKNSPWAKHRKSGSRFFCFKSCCGRLILHEPKASCVSMETNTLCGVWTPYGCGSQMGAQNGTLVNGTLVNGTQD